MSNPTADALVAGTVPSASDQRVVNNIMRHNYRVLNDVEKEFMQRIKDHGLGFVKLLHEIGKTDPNEERQASRNLSLAQTHMEDAVMRAVKHLTG
jgi:hypothetical protein